MAELQTVTISLSGEEIVLKPSMQATRMISRQFNGMQNARTALAQENFDAVAFIIRIGSGMKDRDARDLDDKIYSNGLTGDLLVGLINYVAMLGNSGKPIVLNDEENETNQD
jgi:hypothetical protein